MRVLLLFPRDVEKNDKYVLVQSFDCFLFVIEANHQWCNKNYTVALSKKEKNQLDNKIIKLLASCCRTTYWNDINLPTKLQRRKFYIPFVYSPYSSSSCIIAVNKITSRTIKFAACSIVNSSRLFSV